MTLHDNERDTGSLVGIGPQVWWTFTDSTGVERTGTLEHVSDFGGTDISYRMREDDTGRVFIVNGRGIDTMKRHVM